MIAPNVKKNINCYTCKESSTKCTGCKNNTFLEGEKCYNCTECKKTKSSTDCRCEECNEGKYLVSSLFIKSNWH